MLIASYDSEKRGAYDGLTDKVLWKYETDGCNVELELMIAEGLASENLEFTADAENGVTVLINGMAQNNRPVKGLENGTVEHLTLVDGTQAMTYSAIYETSERTFYFEGALFAYTYVFFGTHEVAVMYSPCVPEAVEGIEPQMIEIAEMCFQYM